MKTVTLSAEELKELKKLSNARAGAALLLDQLQSRLKTEHDVLWGRINELYPETVGRKAVVNYATGKIYIIMEHIGSDDDGLAVEDL